MQLKTKTKHNKASNNKKPKPPLTKTSQPTMYQNKRGGKKKSKSKKLQFKSGADQKGKLCAYTVERI